MILKKEMKVKSKKELRNEILQLRDSLSVEERQEKSHRIAEQVMIQKEFMEADKVLLFASFKREVETCEIFQAATMAGKEVYYPKVIDKEMEFYLVDKEADLIEGYRGISEPIANLEKQFRPKQMDKICVIMPGVVFDAAGNRIGYGGGFYDKFLERLENELSGQNGQLYKLAVAFECQMVEIGNITSESFDIKPNCIVTEKNKFFVI